MINYYYRKAIRTVRIRVHQGVHCDDLFYIFGSSGHMVLGVSATYSALELDPPLADTIQLVTCVWALVLVSGKHA